MLTQDEISARTARAVAAATAAGRELGLRVDEPRVLYDVFSVIVHLVLLFLLRYVMIGAGSAPAGPEHGPPAPSQPDFQLMPTVRAAP